MLFFEQKQEFIFIFNLSNDLNRKSYPQLRQDHEKQGQTVTSPFFCLSLSAPLQPPALRLSPSTHTSTVWLRSDGQVAERLPELWQQEGAPPAAHTRLLRERDPQSIPAPEGPGLRGSLRGLREQAQGRVWAV